MKKNIVFFTTMNEAPDNMEYKKWCFQSWNHWAKKNDAEVFVLDTPLVDKNLMKPTWQRWHVFDILDANGIEYDQVAMVDADTLIHPDAPNFFDLTNHNFAAVQDDLMVEWVHNSIEGYQFAFPEVKFDWTTYFNCGNTDLLRKLQHETLRKGSDQTPVNYMVRSTGTDITYLSKKWNFTHLHQRGVLNDMLPQVGYVYHFNGFEKSWRDERMNYFWQLLKKVCNVEN
jgi:hypothetical protein